MIEQIALFIGFAVIYVVGVMFSLVMIAIMFVCILYAAYKFPKIHFNKPKHEIHLITYDGMETIMEKETRTIQDLTLTRWFGFSSKNKVTWYFGLIRFDKTDD